MFNSLLLILSMDTTYTADMQEPSDCATYTASDDDKTEPVFNPVSTIDFEGVDVDAELIKPNLKLVFVKPVSRPDILIPDVRQLFIDKHGKRVTPSNK